MEEILKTTQLEFDKSAFLIDLVKHDNGLLYVEIIQSIVASEKSDQSIKINSAVLSDIIKVLQNYHARISINTELETKHLTDVEQQKIQEQYFKGITIKNLALLFDQTPELIEMVLRNKGLAIVDNELPKPMNRRKTNKRSKGK